MSTEWPAERTRALKTLAAKGVSYGKIAKYLGLTKNQVVGKVSRLGLPQRRGIEPTPLPRHPIERLTGCRWPNGHPGDADFHFCNADPVPAKPYCIEHCERAYVKLKPGDQP